MYNFKVKIFDKTTLTEAVKFTNHTYTNNSKANRLDDFRLYLIPSVFQFVEVIDDTSVQQTKPKGEY